MHEKVYSLFDEHYALYLAGRRERDTCLMLLRLIIKELHRVQNLLIGLAHPSAVPATLYARPRGGAGCMGDLVSSEADVTF
jgi:hypothetical protein